MEIVRGVVLTSRTEVHRTGEREEEAMTKVLDERVQTIRRRSVEMAMTCDVPAIVRVGLRGSPDVCRPTGRDVTGRRNGRVRVPAATVRTTPRSSVRRNLSNTPSIEAASRSNTSAPQFDPAVFRRRRTIAGLLVGAALALMIGVFAVVGTAYERSAVQEAPAATTVVHVRSGESLSSLAGRVAPGRPIDAVIAQVRRLNGLQQSGLLPGQTLVVPDYR
ncbi:MAG: LysM peptidoglycan-binding domain-containing protein [Gordonia sp. (in: high G+C Gram-positive bacteria)]